MKLRSLLTISSLALLLLACGEKKRVIARVNGEDVTQERFDAYLILKNIPAEDEKRRDSALKEFLEREALAKAIDKQDALDDKLIDAEVEEFRKELLISRYFDQFLEEAVSEETVSELYQKDASQFESRKVHVAHILLRVNKGMDEQQRLAKLTTARELHAKIQTGQDFSELAQQFSEDKISGRKGGDLGWIKEGSIGEGFSKRAFQLKKDQISEPFESPFGFHIIKIIEEPQIIRRPLGAVAGEIRYRLRSEAKDKELKRLKEQASVTQKESYDPKLTPKRPQRMPKAAPPGDAARRAALQAPHPPVDVMPSDPSTDGVDAPSISAAEPARPPAAAPAPSPTPTPTTAASPISTKVPSPPRSKPVPSVTPPPAPSPSVPPAASPSIPPTAEAQP